jgi:C1A family cysteine protease
MMPPNWFGREREDPEASSHAERTERLADPAPVEVSGRHRGPNGRYYGWLPSLPDHRDHQANIGGLGILPEVDPREDHLMPVVYDQGQLGSCTANAVGAALQYHHGLIMDRKARRPSRLDIYYGERALEGSLGQGDTGAFGRDGFKFAQQTGYLLEAEWPYDISTYQHSPPTGPGDTRTKLAEPYVAVSRSVEHFKAVLSNRQTIAFGFSVFESFESEAVAETGIVPMPATSEQQLGGHEVLCVGYTNAHPGYFLVRNSWGPDWGDGGYCWMPTAYFLTPGLSSDFRTIVLST